MGNVTNMVRVFKDTPFNQDISNWDVGKVREMISLFENTPFNQDISSWSVANVAGCSNFSLNAPLTAANTPNFTNCTP